MNIFGDDIDSILGNNDDLNKNINGDELNVLGTEENDDGAANDNEDDDNDNDPNKTGKTVVDPKKRTIRNPQFRLNVARLKGDRGIHTLEHFYKNMKFLGKGHERQDLDNVMKKMEHWAHRLYPKYNFDDFIETAEKLGKKKELQSHMYRYRQGMLEPVAISGECDDQNNENDINMDDQPVELEPIDEFDDLIGQQIEKYRTAPKTPSHETTFNSLKMSSTICGTPTFMERNPIEASTPMSPGVQLLPTTPVQHKTTSSLTSDQMAQIAENRRLAQERLRAKREAMAAAAAAATVTP